ncbi:MAG: hypothetical protein Q4E55_03685 [Bacteroidales bacterium]|nr:hypothetical protein [Bacteroidales bacterium]
MNMFNLVSRFWRAAEEEAFTPSEAALYFYLLHRANTQKWQMPIRCPTTTICVFLSTTKQNMMKAREGLRRRGFIEYHSGSGANDIPQYTLTETHSALSGQLSDEFTPQLSGLLSSQLPLYKNKEKEMSATTARTESILSLEELEKTFLEDEQWQQSVLNLLLARNIKGTTVEILRTQISQFFLYLRASGEKERETNDCKNYFVNWLSKQPFTNPRDGIIKPDNQDRRRASEVSPAPSEAYYQSF